MSTNKTKIAAAIKKSSEISNNALHIINEMEGKKAGHAEAVIDAANKIREQSDELDDIVKSVDSEQPLTIDDVDDDGEDESGEAFSYDIINGMSEIKYEATNFNDIQMMDALKHALEHPKVIQGTITDLLTDLYKKADLL